MDLIADEESVDVPSIYKAQPGIDLSCCDQIFLDKFHGSISFGQVINKFLEQYIIDADHVIALCDFLHSVLISALGYFNYTLVIIKPGLKINNTSVAGKREKIEYSKLIEIVSRTGILCQSAFDKLFLNWINLPDSMGQNLSEFNRAEWVKNDIVAKSSGEPILATEFLYSVVDFVAFCVGFIKFKDPNIKTYCKSFADFADLYKNFY